MSIYLKKKKVKDTDFIYGFQKDFWAAHRLHTETSSGRPVRVGHERTDTQFLWVDLVAVSELQIWVCTPESRLRSKALVVIWFYGQQTGCLRVSKRVSRPLSVTFLALRSMPISLRMKWEPWAFPSNLSRNNMCTKKPPRKLLPR